MLLLSLGKAADMDLKSLLQTVELLLLIVGGGRRSRYAPQFTPSSIFSFGDSLTDTGNAEAAFPRDLDKNWHYGQTYFHHYTGRASDGRLLIDFTAQAFGFPFLSPYLQGIGSDYRHGANFAFRGATARKTNIVTPFYLSAQVDEFLVFKQHVLAMRNSSEADTTYLPVEDAFPSALYFMFIGLNDFWQNFHNKKKTINEVKTTIMPQILNGIVDAIQRLYTHGGARKFMIVNVPAIGCLPNFLSEFGKGHPSEYDSNGCLIAYNNIAHQYNTNLQGKLKRLQQELSNSSINYADLYRLHMDAMEDPSKYGFEKIGQLTACCGGGGKYRRPVAACGLKSTSVCSSPSTYINWDGIHFTEGFNKFVANSFFAGHYLKRTANFTSSEALIYVK